MLVVFKVGVEDEADAPSLHDVVSQPDLHPVNALRQTLESLSQLLNLLRLARVQIFHVCSGLHKHLLIHVGLARSHRHRVIDSLVVFLVFKQIQLP